MNPPSQIIDSVKAAMAARVAASDVVTVVGKLFAGSESRRFTHDLVAFDYELVAILIIDDPLAAKQGDRVFGVVLQRHEIDEGMRFVRRQGLASVVVDQFVETGGEAG